MKTVFSLLVGTAIVGASTVPPGSAGLQGSSERAIEGSDLVHADFGRSLDLDSGKHNPLIHHKDFSSLHAKVDNYINKLLKCNNTTTYNNSIYNFFLAISNVKSSGIFFKNLLMFF